MNKRIYSLLLLVTLALTACGRPGDAQLDGQFNAASVRSCDASTVGTTYQSSCNTCSCVQKADGRIVEMCTQIQCN
jgi:predicted small lipoprotein YifL